MTTILPFFQPHDNILYNQKADSSAYIPGKDRYIMISLIIHGKQIAEKFVKDEMTVYAAQASFFIVLSAFPFIMVLMTVVQLVPNLSQHDVGAIILALVPDVRTIAPLIQDIINDVYTRSPGTVLSITIILALWSASKGMLGMERGLNRAYECQIHRNYIIGRIICIGYTLLFLLTCILSLILIVFGSSIQTFFENTFPIIAEVTRHILNFRTLLAILVMTVCFMGIYTYLPHRRQTLMSQLPGAVFSTAGWLLFSFGFSIYFNHFSRFSYMYGSLTAVILLMLWIYFCICILFVGAEINYYYGKFHYHKELERH